MQYIGRIFGYMCSLGIVAIITRRLGVHDYGEFTTALAVATLIITFSDFGFFWSTIHGVSNTDDKAKVVSEIAGIKLVVTLATLIIGALVVYLGHFSIAVRESFWILSIFVLSSSLNNVLVAVYQSEYRMVHPTVAEALSRLINLVLVFFGMIKGYGLEYFIAATTFAALANVLINWGGLNRLVGLIRPRVFGYSWSVYYRTVFLLGLIQLLYVTFYRVDVIILSWLKPAVDVGIYGIVVKVTEIISAVSSIFVGALFPTLVESFKVDKAKFLEYVSRSFLVLFSLALPIALYGQWFNYDLIKIIGGREFLTTSTVTFAGHQIYAQSILSIALVFCALNYLSSVFYTALLAAEKMRILLVFNFVCLAVNIGLNIVFVPHYSYLTTMGVTAITEVVILILTAGYFIKKFQYRLPFGQIFLLILATLPGVAFLVIVSPQSLLLRFAVTAVLYFGTMALILPKSRRVLGMMLRGKTPVND